MNYPKGMACRTSLNLSGCLLIESKIHDNQSRVNLEKKPSELGDMVARGDAARG